MPVDEALLGEAKAAETRLIEAQHATEVAQADFHRAVRRLHLAGASLREMKSADGAVKIRLRDLGGVLGLDETRLGRLRLT